MDDIQRTALIITDDDLEAVFTETLRHTDNLEVTPIDLEALLSLYQTYSNDQLQTIRLQNNRNGSEEISVKQALATAVYFGRSINVTMLNRRGHSEFERAFRRTLSESESR